MGYLERPAPTNRGGVLIAVGLIHAVGIYAVVTGLGAVVVHVLTDRHTGTYDVPPETVVPVDPPRPLLQGKATKATRSTDARQPVVTVPLGPTSVLPPLELPATGGGGEVARPEPPAVPPGAAVPLGNPGGWATEAD
ncbi:MAG: hypothetical protein KGM17_13235 [Sphingomonadales bacterium]|nr:hypothetical protein [Sphingomonadales bacterium]